MVENILPAYPLPQNPRDGTIGQNSTFLEHGHVAYQLKRESRNAATWYQIFCPQIPHTHIHSPLTGSIGQNSAFSEHGHVAYPIK